MLQLAAIERFRQACAADRLVLAAFLGGSFAAGTADVHSDLDLYVIGRDRDYRGLHRNRHRLVEGMGRPVFMEDVDHGFDMVVFVLEDGVRGELGLAAASRFGHIHGGPHTPLLDREGLLAGYEFAPWSRDRGQVEEDVRSVVSWFWHDAILFWTALHRGRPWTALGRLERLRARALQVWRLASGHTDLHQGCERVEDVLDGGDLDRWQSTLGGAEPPRLDAAARAVTDLFRQRAPGLCAHWNIPYPQPLEDVALRHAAARRD